MRSPWVAKKPSDSNRRCPDPFSLEPVPYSQPTTETGRGSCRSYKGKELQEFRSCRMGSLWVAKKLSGSNREVPDRF
jgi:hypothetical protein